MNKKFTSLIIIALFIGILFIPSCEAFIKYESRVLLNERGQATNEILFDRNIELLMRFAHKPSVSACIIKMMKLSGQRDTVFIILKKINQHNQTHFICLHLFQKLLLQPL